MLVVKPTQTLVMRPAVPEQVLRVVSSAKRLRYRDKGLVAVPHQMREVCALRSIGLRAPSPIRYYYDWPGGFAPYAHQEATAAFLTLHRRCLVLNDIGTGKSLSALWAADYLMREGLVRKVLILSPLSTLERVWGDSVFMHFFHRRHVVLYGSAERRKRLLKTNADFYIINHDGFNIISDDIDEQFDLVIVDEAAVYRNASTNRYRAFNKWRRKHPETRLWLMTGTPTPNAPTDAWALAKLVDSANVPRTFSAFRDHVMFKRGQWAWEPRADSSEVVKHVLQPSIRFTRDECGDLPDTITQTRVAPLTAEQEKHYGTMLKTFIAETAGQGRITAVNEAVKLQKLVQIACGVAYTDTGEEFALDCAPRVSAVKEVIAEAGEKIIIFVPLTGTLHMLERELSKHWTTAVVNGAVPRTQRDEIFRAFQDDTDPHVLIAHPATMAHGLTLTSASTIIWYGPITSNEQYVQANGRVERIGKRHVSNVVHIEGTKLERKMYHRLANKQKLQGLLLELVQKATEDGA